MNLKVVRILTVFLWLVALHSFLVGIGLVVLPSSVFELLGFKSTFDRFFSTQGGVFHIAMAFSYAMAAYDLKRFKQLIVFSILVKFIATIFLLLYFIIASSQLLIVFSGISDFVMGLVILLLYKKLNQEMYFNLDN
ncbi:MAG: hypothetical protein IPJ23_10200 [Ignavibacteriales bacterium]|nr:hypothetical protein [Ignavibacteriales bacterium]